MFAAHAKRVAVERVHKIKEAMVGGVWSNSNYDDGKTRADLLQKIDEFATQAIASIYDPVEDDGKLDMNNPFLAAMKLPGVEEIDHNKDRDKVGELS
jgi:hypothetical protein